MRTILIATMLFCCQVCFAAGSAAAPCKLCLYGPDNMTFDAAGNIYLTDSDHQDHSRVLKLSAQGDVLAEWHVFAAVPGRYNGPDGISIDSAGDIFVIDGGRDQLLKLSPRGEVLTRLTGFSARAFDDGGHVAIGKDGAIYVVAAGPNLIQKYSPLGKPIESWHRDKGPGLDQWSQPETISVDHAGNLVIADWGNHRVLTLAPDGKTLRAFEAVPNQPLNRASVAGAVVGPDGNIYVADYQLYQVQEFAPDGRLLATIGNTPEVTLFQKAPNSIAIDAQGNLYSTDGLSVIKFSKDGILLARWQ